MKENQREIGGRTVIVQSSGYDEERVLQANVGVVQPNGFTVRYACLTLEDGADTMSISVERYHIGPEELSADEMCNFIVRNHDTVKALVIELATPLPKRRFTVRISVHEVDDEGECGLEILGYALDNASTDHHKVENLMNQLIAEGEEKWSWMCFGDTISPRNLAWGDENKQVASLAEAVRAGQTVEMFCPKCDSTSTVLSPVHIAAVDEILLCSECKAVLQAVPF
jgi:hypothetical protein